ncbi:hypothetical protein CDAR_122571 [Caerostris darwini]|uniref:Uncharacterized protein n=1 Tax=Caerostris darwini TaxID=1538125 RepID=A0AAV4MDF9_9ARAC|nr:hypothetical protein CDAR_122571 [Caerostris darwini]
MSSTAEMVRCVVQKILQLDQNRSRCEYQLLRCLLLQNARCQLCPECTITGDVSSDASFSGNGAFWTKLNLLHISHSRKIITSDQNAWQMKDNNVFL